ncbi:hypothetical protein HN51_011821 [Arachis hypogaea]|uniref:Uncharacterized protein n=1 Tax=Arachis hypogaea TaxID=3818 RepID=A0A445DXD0_ARAHY|nr:uncharacterized protein LOC112790283 [Arachis hypogaea]QHO57197.1 uncharacterized protein DS421_3g80190 [Arachis hypogaea]RYR67848.1 hypothetical protein Ahy_A03g014296 [Arachis hypogaea]
MEECNNKKRVRDDSDTESPESKIPRVDSPVSQLTRVNSAESCEESGGWELVRIESENSVVEELHGEILNILDDMDNVAERDSTFQGLDSVIKSFEEEILASGQDSNPVPEFGDFIPNLGYLLEASDDELGLPPTVTPTEEVKPEIEESGRVGPDGLDLTGFLGIEDDFRGYEAFGFGNGGLVDYDDSENDYVMIDGLFDYADTTDILWRPESLQAM